MLYAILICSDPECAEELEAVGDLAELESLACDCGCALQAIAFCEYEEATIPAPAKRFELPLAA